MVFGYFSLPHDEGKLLMEKGGQVLEAMFLMCVYMFLDGRWMDSSTDGSAVCSESQGRSRPLLSPLSTRENYFPCATIKKNVKRHVIPYFKRGG